MCSSHLHHSIFTYKKRTKPVSSHMQHLDQTSLSVEDSLSSREKKEFEIHLPSKPVLNFFFYMYLSRSKIYLPQAMGPGIFSCPVIFCNNLNAGLPSFMFTRWQTQYTEREHVKHVLKTRFHSNQLTCYTGNNTQRSE